MRFGVGQDGERRDARSGTSGPVTCAWCGDTLLLRRGAVVAAHYAHTKGSTCPSRRTRVAVPTARLFDVPAVEPGTRFIRHRAAPSAPGQLELDLAATADMDDVRTPTADGRDAACVVSSQPQLDQSGRWFTLPVRALTALAKRATRWRSRRR